MLAIDLYCGLGGWTYGLLAEGWDVIGYDIEHHEYDGIEPYPAELRLQDVTTIDGADLKEASLIVASPPCQEFSYRTLPFKRCKARHPSDLGFKPREWWNKTEDQMNEDERYEWEWWKANYPLPPCDTKLFNACDRIRREASAAAGRELPIVVENVKGAKPWIGPAAAHYGSFYLWGDVADIDGDIVALAPGLPGRLRVPASVRKNEDLDGGSWFNVGHPQAANGANPVKNSGRKVQTHVGVEMPAGTGATSWFHGNAPHESRGVKRPRPQRNGLNVGDNNTYRATGKPSPHFTDPTEKGVKCGGDWFSADEPSPMRRHASKSQRRKAATADIAKIPAALSQYIARAFKP